MTGSASNCHIVAVPYPGRGHINPMLNLCRLILDSAPEIAVSFVVTEEWLGILLAGNPPPLPRNFRFETIPNVLPSEIGRGKDSVGFFTAALTLMADPVEQLLDRLPPPAPRVIIYDNSLTWAVAAGRRRSIPVASFYTMSATVFSILHHSDLILQSEDWSSNISDEQGKEKVINNIPGVLPLRIKDLPTEFHGYCSNVLHQSLEYTHMSTEAQYILFASIYELESQVFDNLKQNLSSKIYSLGFTIPYLNLEKSDSTDSEKPHYLNWLDVQPESSVLYISQGSHLSVSSDQLDRIIGGVCKSGIRFLWITRGEAERVNERSGGNGLAVPWCNQLKVLCHPSVGGFWTHCGWNSTKEGAFAGLPMLTMPIMWDQTTNSKMIVDDWRIGLRVEGSGEGCLVSEDEVARLVLRIMDGESEEGKERRRRAKEISQICRSACSKGGSADLDILAFVRDISGI